MSTIDPGVLIEFWYLPRVSACWFKSTPQLDTEIRQRFEVLWREARGGGLEAWEQTAQGCLALAIVLDQLPLNMFRGRPESFSTEAAAIEVVKRALARGLDQQLAPDRRAFLYMPLMHSEAIDDQDLAVGKFGEAGLDGNEKFACHHREIIRRFGRFPHRNAILGRASTPEEIAWLDSPEGFGG